MNLCVQAKESEKGIIKEMSPTIGVLNTERAERFKEKGGSLVITPACFL